MLLAVLLELALDACGLLLLGLAHVGTQAREAVGALALNGTQRDARLAQLVLQPRHVGRLAERPQNLAFFARSLVSKK